MKENVAAYAIHLGDQTLILGQSLAGWCAHGPALEIDIALSNIALDLLGQTRSYYLHGAELSDKYKNEDEIAFLRKPNEYTNSILVEMPNGNFADTICRQFLFDQFHFLFLQDLINSNEKQFSAIAEKSIKEVTYHLRFSRDWVLRLGDGTEESHHKLQAALNNLWPYTKELFNANSIELEMFELGIAPNLSSLEEIFYTEVTQHLAKATLIIPENKWSMTKGKTGVHTEQHGFILADLQYMQRAYPNSKW